MPSPLTVLQSLPAERPTTNPYLLMLGRGLRASGEITLLNFSFAAALTGRYDLFHVHWPENLLTADRRWKRLARRLLTTVFLLRLSITRRPVVRTLHNVHPPEGLGLIDRGLLAWLTRLTSVWIVLSEHTPEPSHGRTVLVPHGHYRDWYAPIHKSTAQPRRIAYAGLIRRYKGVESLVTAFVATPDAARLTLVVAGKPSSDELASAIAEEAAGDARIDFRLHYLTDEELVEVISSAELVVLPYRFMHNSGGALAALSLDRPILVPDNEVNRSLGAEVGAGWVHRFEGDLTPAALLAAMSAPRPGGVPDLSRREWADSVQGHLRAYRTALD